MKRQLIWMLAATLIGSIVPASDVPAQAVAGFSRPEATGGRNATLEELLNSRLRSTQQEQKAFIRYLVRQVKEGRLDIKLVVAIQRKAVARNRFLPFPYFERAMRYEAAKRRVSLPPVRQFATTKLLPTDLR